MIISRGGCSFTLGFNRSQAHSSSKRRERLGAKLITAVIIIASLLAIASLIGVKPQLSQQPVGKEGNTSLQQVTLGDVLEIPYEKPGLRAVYTVPPPQELYNSAISYAEKGLRYHETALADDDFIALRLAQAREELGKARSDTWEGLFHALNARDAIAEAMAYMNASRGMLTLHDIEGLRNDVSKRLKTLLEKDRYHGDSLPDVLVGSYQVERHLYKAHVMMMDAAKILESDRPMEIRIAYAYSSLIAASTHTTIAAYLASYTSNTSTGGSDLSIEVSTLNRKLLDTLNQSLQAASANATSVLGEAERLFNRATMASSLGLHSYSIFNALHAHLLLKASTSIELRDPYNNNNIWRVTPADLYKVKLDAIKALDNADSTGDKVADLLLYRLYGYISSGDELVAKAVERDAKGDSMLLRLAYTEYVKAKLTAEHLQDTLNFLYYGLQ